MEADIGGCAIPSRLEIMGCRPSSSFTKLHNGNESMPSRAHRVTVIVETAGRVPRGQNQHSGKRCRTRRDRQVESTLKDRKIHLKDHRESQGFLSCDGTLLEDRLAIISYATAFRPYTTSFPHLSLKVIADASYLSYTQQCNAR